MEKAELRYNQTKINITRSPISEIFTFSQNVCASLHFTVLILIFLPISIVQQLALIDDLGQVLNECLLNVIAIEDA